MMAIQDLVAMGSGMKPVISPTYLTLGNLVIMTKPLTFLTVSFLCGTEIRGEKGMFVKIFQKYKSRQIWKLFTRVPESPHGKGSK